MMVPLEGNTENPARPEVGFCDLPNEIVEDIFYRVPHADLLSTATRVCTRWRDTICSPQFMQYKKVYYAYKKGRGDQFVRARNELEDLARRPEHNMNEVTACFVGYIQRMATFVPASPHGSWAMIKQAVEEVPNHAAIILLFSEQHHLKFCMDWSSQPPEPNPLCTLAMMLVVADDMETVSSLLRHLLRKVEIPYSLIMEFFYATATFFLFFHRAFKLPDKHHYIVFSAIHATENKTKVSPITVESLFDRRAVAPERREPLLRSPRFSQMTYEQFKILNHELAPREVIKIIAFAGTGKTTTLISYTEVRERTRFLYIAYNKAIQLDAAKRFPTNVVCKTIHSIAHGVTGALYQQNRKVGNVYPGNVFSGLKHMQGFNTFTRATYALRTVERFIASPDPHINMEHVPTRSKDGFFKVEDRERFLSDAQDLWEKMQDLNDKTCMTHDGYLKLFQLRVRVDFATAMNSEPFDVILVDEAQDMNPASIDLVQRQNVSTILVGDPNQQIYCFRGAVNAMSVINSSKTFYLTKSFRFGPRIAHVCDSLLTGLKDIADKTVIGNDSPSFIDGRVVGRVCVITRSNHKQFSETVEAIGRSSHWNPKENEPPRPQIFFAGNDKKEMYFRQLMEVYYLYANRKGEIWNNSYIKKFDSFDQLRKHSEKVEDVEVMGKCNIVQEFKNDVERHVNNIKRHMCKSEEEADIIFSTAHKAKGLEFDTVKIAGFLDHDLDPMRMIEDEKNILYVAVSRAKKSLIMSDSLVRLLRRFGESYVSLCSNLNQQSSPIDPNEDEIPLEQRCLVRLKDIPMDPPIRCEDPVCVENSWILHRPALTIKLPYEEETSENTVKDGSFCRGHGYMAMPAFVKFLKPVNRSIDMPVKDPDADTKDAVEEEEDDYDKITLDHFYPAFPSPWVSVDLI